MNPIECINQFYQAIIDKNVEKICQSYVQDEQTYVVLEGPRLTTLGFSKIQKGWIDFCASSLTLDAIDWLEGPFCEETSEMAWLGGIIRLKVGVKDHSFEQTFRASFVVRKNAQNSENTEGAPLWLIRHEHVSGALADPYGIGDWLKK